MAELLFRADAYRRQAPGRVLAHADTGGAGAGSGAGSAVGAGASAGSGVLLDASLFYPTGGGQPGDCGHLTWPGGEMQVVTSVRGEAGQVVLVAAEAATLPPVGAQVTQRIDWENRYRLMRVHTALHLFSVVLPLPVTGGAISADKGRLDFAMPEPPADKQALEDALNALIARDLEVSEAWITEAELAAQPELVKTMSVAPPKGAGRVRLVRIGTPEEQVDLQPCGGTHVARTGEIGRVWLGKVQKKGALNRRFNIHLGERP